MRTCIAIVLLVVATVSLAASGDGLPDPGAKPRLLWIAATPIDFSADSKSFLPDYETDQKYLIDVQEVKRWSGYKPLVITYWVYAVVKSYEHDRIKLKSYLGYEPTVNASFQTLEGSRAVFVPRTHPAIFFPLGKDKKTVRVFTIHWTGGGLAVSYAVALGPPRPRRN